MRSDGKQKTNERARGAQICLIVRVLYVCFKTIDRKANRCTFPCYIISVKMIAITCFVLRLRAKRHYIHPLFTLPPCYVANAILWVPFSLIASFRPSIDKRIIVWMFHNHKWNVQTHDKRVIVSIFIVANTRVLTHLTHNIHVVYIAQLDSKELRRRNQNDKKMEAECWMNKRKGPWRVKSVYGNETMKR